MEVTPELRTILSENPEFCLSADGKRIKCNLSGHEMPPTFAAVTAYMNGKKYKKLRAVAELQMPKEYEEHLVPSTKPQSKGKLFCNLTWRHINNVPKDILRHVNGKRFKKQLARWKICQENGTKFEARPNKNRNKEINELNGEFEKVNIGDEEGNESDGSNLSDLYPRADFESDSEWEDMSEEDISEQPKASKRKLNQSITAKKKKVQKK